MSSNSESTFHCSAPGKVILFGEHAVVYPKKSAIATSISQRCFVDVVPTSGKEKFQFVVKALQVDVSFHFDNLVEWLQDNLYNQQSYCSSLRFPTFLNAQSAQIPVTDCERLPIFQSELLTLLEKQNYFIVGGEQYLVSSVNAQALTSLQAFAYLLTLYAYTVFIENELNSVMHPSLRFECSTTIPIGAGLGSSAAFSVSISAAFLLCPYLLHHTNPNFHRKITLSQAMLYYINRWGFLVETLIHGTPSGVDNYCATFGGFVRYIKGEKPKRFLSSSPNLTGLELIVTNTCVARSTKALVAHVRDQYQKDTHQMEKILDQIESVVEQSQKTIVEIYQSSGDQQSLDKVYTQLEALIDQNHKLLNTIGVGHASLDQVAQIAQTSCDYHSKLTGAGGGGCIFTLVNPFKKAHVDLLKQALAKAGFQQAFQTVLGGSGLQIALKKHN